MYIGKERILNILLLILSLFLTEKVKSFIV